MSFIQCHFDYACSFWYQGLSQLLRNRLQVTKNKMIRFVLKLDPGYHIGSDIFKSLGWLPVSKRVDQIILNHIFRNKSGTSPDYMGEHFIPASSVHNYSTLSRFRENGNFLYPKVKGFGRKSFAFTGCSLWNRLPPNVKNVNELNKSFKTLVKSHLLNSV